MYWGKRELSFLNGAKCIIDFLEDLALFDSRFCELNYIGLKKAKNQIMKFGEKAIEVDFLATKIFDEQLYWLKKRYPIDIHDITSSKHFGITPLHWFLLPYYRSSLSIYSFLLTRLLYAGRMILSVVINSSRRCALQPAILAIANNGVYNSLGIFNMSYTKPL